ncbi:MAG TPA: hypothetical protein VJ225_02585 [Nitrososphaeraceae archaeon]|nr:hypothetical protein [Nitrososphaeraceae archaeon]
MKGEKDSGNDKGVTIKQESRQNPSQFVILGIVNAFVGAMIGLEQTNCSAIDWQGSIWNRIQTTDLNNRRTYRTLVYYTAPIKDQ